MADKFDPYREALVMETETVWSDDYDEFDHAEKERLSAALHADPESCESIEYVRMHTGFCRRIVVTEDDLARVSS